MDVLQILQAYYQQQVYSFTGSVPDEIKKMNQQSLSGYLYFVYGKPFEQVYLGCTLIQQKFYHLQNEITEWLNAAELNHLFIKGSILSKLYPDEALRLRGDIDVLVHPKDYSTAQKLLEAKGFERHDECEHHVEYLYQGLVVELHQSLFEKGDVFYSYFEDVFSHATLVSHHLYELEHAFHYLYCLAHLNKHLATGEGIRYILDFYYMQKNWNLDMGFLEKEIHSLHLDQLYKSIQGAIYLITKESFQEPLEAGTGQELIDYMLQKGVHSKNEVRTKATFSYQNFIGSNQSKSNYLFQTLFLPNREMRARVYPRLSKCIVFYPILLIHRFFHLFIFRLPNLFKILFSKKKKIEKDRKDWDDIGIKPL